MLLRLHSSASTFKIQVQFFIRAKFQNFSRLTLYHFHKVNVNNCYGKCFSKYLLFFQAIFTIEKIIIRSRNRFDLQNNVEVTFSRTGSPKNIFIFLYSSRSHMFFKIGAHKILQYSQRKHLRWRLFLIKLQAFRPATLLKRGSYTDVFL